jgi:hypothetical protein
VQLLRQDGDEVGHRLDRACPERSHAIHALGQRPELGLVPAVVASRQGLPRTLFAGLDVDGDGY